MLKLLFTLLLLVEINEIKSTENDCKWRLKIKGTHFEESEKGKNCETLYIKCISYKEQVAKEIESKRKGRIISICMYPRCTQCTLHNEDMILLLHSAFCILYLKVYNVFNLYVNSMLTA